MARVEKTIDVDVPVRTAYNQWTQFEEFPRFMEGVHEVTQMDERRLHWRADVGGQDQEWDAEIREQVPDQKIIWKSTSGAGNAGMVTFDQLGPSKTRVHLEMSYDPEGFVENVGDKLGVISRRVEGDLERFKSFIEERGAESGGWRGEIRNEDAPGGHTSGSMEWGQSRSASPGEPGVSSMAEDYPDSLRGASSGSSMPDYQYPEAQDRAVDPDRTDAA